MFCAECGKTLSPNDKFCSGCSTRVPVQTVPETYHQIPQRHNAQDAVRPQRVQTPPPVQEQARYCGNCGQRMGPGDRFCLKCGGQAGGAPGYGVPAQPQKKKSSKMKIWGIVLVVLQCLVVLGSLDEMASMDIFELLGYLMIGIIGVILLIRDHQKNKN